MIDRIESGSDSVTWLDATPIDPPADFAANALVGDESLHEEAARDPQAWWAKLARELEWFVEPTNVLDDSNPPFFKWFADGKLNASVSCLDRQVEAGLGDRVAYHWRGEEGEERDITYADLYREVQRLANVLKDRGVEAGDVVGIYPPTIPEVAIAMLACALNRAPRSDNRKARGVDQGRDRMIVLFCFVQAAAARVVDSRRASSYAWLQPDRGSVVATEATLSSDCGHDMCGQVLSRSTPRSAKTPCLGEATDPASSRGHLEHQAWHSSLLLSAWGAGGEDPPAPCLSPAPAGSASVAMRPATPP